MTTTFATLAAIAAASVLGAQHDGAVVGDEIVWRSRMAIDGGGEVPLRVTLPAHVAVDVVASDATVLRDAAGRAVGLRVPAGYRIVELATRQRADVDALHPPLVATTERVALGAGARFTPAPDLGIEARIGRYAAHDVGARDDAHLERTLGRPARRGDSLPILLGPDTSASLRARGLVGDLVVGDAHKAPLAAGLALVAACVAAALALVVRALGRRAALERADAVIEREWRDAVGR